MEGYVKSPRDVVGRRPLVLVAAGVLILDSLGHVLLCRRADDGTSVYPGGYIEPGETTEEAARREVFEETGLIEHMHASFRRR